MFGFREVCANRKLDQASFRVTNYSTPRNRRHHERVAVVDLRRRGVLLETEEPAPPTTLRPTALYARLPVSPVGWGVGSLDRFRTRLEGVSQLLQRF
jgi:hypothetical protein